MRTAVTGATGLVGSNLVIELLNQGHEVRGTRRATSQVDHLSNFDVEWVLADLEDKSSLEKAFEGCDAVFHCAARVVMESEPSDATVSVNINGTKNVMQACRANNVDRLVSVSSVVAVGVSDDGEPIDETAEWNMPKHNLDDGYAITKRRSQELVMNAANDPSDPLDAVVVNPSYMFGPYDPKPSSGEMIIRVVDGNLPGYPTGIGNFVDVRDVASGIVKAYEQGSCGENYILGGDNMSYESVMEMIAEEAGVAPPRFPIPWPIAKLAGWYGDIKQKITGEFAQINSNTIQSGYSTGSVYSSEKAKKQLGYSPGPVRTAISDAIAWFRKHGMLSQPAG